MNVILIVVIVLLLVGGAGLPQTGWHQYGYWPSGTVGLILLILLVLALAGRG